MDFSGENTPWNLKLGSTIRNVHAIHYSADELLLIFHIVCIATKHAYNSDPRKRNNMVQMKP